jgi:MFS family permease
MRAINIARPLSGSEHRAYLRRAVVASTVGTTIEWYDFLIFTIVTGLVFGNLYFPDADPLVGALKAFGVFFVGFVARPIGALIFGHYGDRFGRKATLIVTLLMTGIATAAVGLVPGYDVIGIWGGIILTALRIVQGIGVGGEWGGSVALAMEWARTNKDRGLIASWPQLGAPAGTCLAYVAVLAFSWLSGDQFLVWGWRIPFLLSIGMVGIGLWMRLGVLETPVFQRLLADKKIERAPIVEVLKRQPREVILAALVRLAELSPGYIFNAFVFTYGTTVLGASRNLLLSGLIVASLLGCVWGPIAGALSDCIGRGRMYVIGCVSVGLFIFVYFALLGSNVPGLMFLAVALSFLPVMTMYGPEAALIAEAFKPCLRYSGASIGYQFASIVAGGLSPFISTWLFASYHSTIPICIYVVLCAAISIVASCLLTGRTQDNENVSSEVHASQPDRDRPGSGSPGQRMLALTNDMTAISPDFSEGSS